MKHVICTTIPKGLTVSGPVVINGELHFLAPDDFECAEASYIAQMDKDGKVEVLQAAPDFKVKHVFGGWVVPPGYEFVEPVKSLGE